MGWKEFRTYIFVSGLVGFFLWRKSGKYVSESMLMYIMYNLDMEGERAEEKSAENVFCSLCVASFVTC